MRVVNKTVDTKRLTLSKFQRTCNNMKQISSLCNFMVVIYASIYYHNIITDNYATRIKSQILMLLLFSSHLFLSIGDQSNSQTDSIRLSLLSKYGYFTFDRAFFPIYTVRTIINIDPYR